MRLARLSLIFLVAAATVACGGAGSSAAKAGPNPASSAVTQSSQPASASTSTSHQNIVLVANGFTQMPADMIGNSYISYAAVLMNPNPTKWIAEQISVNLAFSDASGTVVKSASETVDVLEPGQTLAVGDSTQAKGATKLDVQALVGRWESVSGTLGDFSIAGVSTTSDAYSMKTNGTVASTFAKDLKTLRATAIYYDSSGSIIGGAYTFLDFVPSGGKAAFEVTSMEVVPNVAKTDVMVGLSNLSLLGG